jgi:hypothetical protein
MDNCLITFGDKYFEYDGDKDVYDKGLTIGGYESAWLADLVGTFVLDHTEHLFRESPFSGIYRDDGLVAFNGKQSPSEIVSWLDEFQLEVNRVTDYDGLQFIMCLWDKDEIGFAHERMSIEEEDFLPFLDMKLFWNKQEELTFTVFHKPGQQIKYLNRDSTHPPHVFRAIKFGILKRLSSLTTASTETKENLLHRSTQRTSMHYTMPTSGPSTPTILL